MLPCQPWVRKPPLLSVWLPVDRRQLNTVASWAFNHIQSISEIIHWISLFWISQLIFLRAGIRVDQRTVGKKYISDWGRDLPDLPFTTHCSAIASWPWVSTGEDTQAGTAHRRGFPPLLLMVPGEDEICCNHEAKHRGDILSRMRNLSSMGLDLSKPLFTRNQARNSEDSLHF